MARLRALHSDLIDPTIAIHHGRVVAVESSHTIDIDCFVPKSEIDERYVDSPYYLVPENKVGLEAFAVIRDAMRGKDNGDALRFIKRHGSSPSFSAGRRAPRRPGGLLRVRRARSCPEMTAEERARRRDASMGSCCPIISGPIVRPARCGCGSPRSTERVPE